VEEREVRLAHAREHCDVYIDTTDLRPEEVLQRALVQLSRHLGDDASTCVARQHQRGEEDEAVE
jgi:hypothetical protein